MNVFLNEIWGINKLYINNFIQLHFKPQESAILLSCNDKNYDRYISLNSFCEILKKANLKTNLYDVQIAQIGIINSIKNLQISRSEIIFSLNKIYENGIISLDDLTKITDFLNSLKLISDENLVKITQKNDIFHSNINILNDCYKQIKSITSNQNLLNLLENSHKNANEAHFFISVTGVVNSGKSSMLNSLLDFNILGSSNVPETANLTVLKFSNDSYASVKFWSDKELEEFGLKNENKKSDLRISIDELKYYTTAKNDISRFVKMVELGVNNNILKDGIVIVDTPGLDDTVVLREELTKKFMHESDFVIHLMNASQSVTKKDINFIKNFLLHAKADNFIVVLTHIDLLSENELKDALNYTKNSIIKELLNNGYNASLINDVKFFTISNVNKNGIISIKNYLYNTFFGQNSKKSAMILSNYKKELNNILLYLKDEFEFEFGMYNLDKAKFNDEFSNLEKEIDILNKEIEQINDLFDENLKKLDYSNLSAFSHLKNISVILKDRVMSDIKYADKNRKKVNFDRIFTIANGGFDDLLLDLFREIKFRVSKDMQNISDQILSKINLSDKNINSFDIKDFFDKNFKKPDYALLNSKLSSIIKAKGSNMQDDLQTLFDEFISFLDIKNSILKLIESYTMEFRLYFKNIVNFRRSILEEKISMIKEHILKLDLTSKDSTLHIEKLKQNLELINTINSRINEC